jgi:signal transduction histidine kinase
MASHDFRNPLQVIASCVEMLADARFGPVTPAQLTALNAARANVGYLAEVANSVLTLAAARRRGNLALGNVNLLELLHEARALIEPFAHAGEIALAVKCDPTIALVHTHRAALLRVLVNLIGNAIKFTPARGCVSVGAVRRPGYIELRIADSGPGIATDQLDAIFEPFLQLSLSADVGNKGTGLGLTIARDLTRMMGGELIVQSVVGLGSLFAVRLPTGPSVAVDESDSADRLEATGS